MARCAICGQNRKLSAEHVPPKSAYNDSPLLRYHMIVYPHHDRKYIKGTTSTGALVKKTICKKCNNNTGGWYGSAYAEFAKQMAHYADRCPSREVIVHPNSAKIYTTLHNIYPARVIKQALCMFCATCGTRLADEYPNMYPEIRERILDKNSRGQISGLKLWLYIRSVYGGKLTGLGRLANKYLSMYSGNYSEVSCWPVGWMMTLDGKEMPKLCEVTRWLGYDYNDKDNMLVLLPHGETTFNRNMLDPARLSDL